MAPESLTGSMTPEKIISSVNRENESLLQKLTDCKQERDTLKNQVEVLQKLIREKRGISDSITFDNGTLMRKLEEERWNTEAAHRDNEALRGEISVMGGHIAELQGRQHAMAIQLEWTHGEIRDRDYYIDGLHGHIACIERDSDEGNRASTAAAAKMEAFFQGKLAAMSEANACLSTRALELGDHSKRLEQVIRWANSLHEATHGRTWARLCQAQSDVSANKHRIDILERRRVKINRDLQALKKRSAKLVSARDALAADNDALKEEVKKSNRKAEAGQAKARAMVREATEEAAAAKGQAAEEIKRLELLIKEMMEETQTQEALQKKLEKDMSAEDASREGYEAALEEAQRLANQYKKADAEKAARITSMERRIETQKKQNKDMVQTLCGMQAQLEWNKVVQEQQTADAEKALRKAFHQRAQLQFAAATAEALSQENNRLRGQSLLSMQIMLEALGNNKQALSIHILEIVIERLGGIDSAPAANRAVDEIRGFLYAAHARIKNYQQAAIMDGAAVKSLIEDIEKMTPLRADKDDVNDVSRLCGEIQQTMRDVNSLVMDLKKEAAAAERPGKGFLRPGELLFGNNLEEPEEPQWGSLESALFFGLKSIILVVCIVFGLRLSEGWPNTLKGCACLCVCLLFQRPSCRRDTHGKKKRLLQGQSPTARKEIIAREGLTAVGVPRARKILAGKKVTNSSERKPSSKQERGLTAKEDSISSLG